ncbi:MAG TPA: CpsD/CapB family tyrosine-protein kinase [Blastocatellia bacterium]|jgi:Mrp family chromosome partitioning ATPase|nr:CpsD/CapB family tyrosine-protein kinase [Blastocatellia bacterium]
MGRVYNALVKADRLPGRERPIGRPASYAAHSRPARAGIIGGHAAIEAARIEPAPTALAPAPPTPQPPAPVFEEPREITNIRSLTIDPHLVALTAQDALAQERYRSLGVRVINAASGRKIKTIAVTSAEEGEGKTTVAINLAWVLANRSERRVLLIDASMRSPSVSRMLGLASARGWLGLADDLSGLAGVMVRLDPNGLYVMAPGIPPAQTGRRDMAADLSGALISSCFENILRGLRQKFDLVVIDAPPVLASADAQYLASVADGTVVVARSGVTHHGRVTGALALVPEDRRVGIVLNESEVSEGAAPHRPVIPLISRLFGRRK